MTEYRKIGSISKYIFSILIRNLNCAICQELFIEPIRLKCGHTYCSKCILAWINRAEFDCPICRIPFVSGTEEPRNILRDKDFAAANLVNDLKCAAVSLNIDLGSIDMELELNSALKEEAQLTHMEDVSVAKQHTCDDGSFPIDKENCSSRDLKFQEFAHNFDVQEYERNIKEFFGIMDPKDCNLNTQNSIFGGLSLWNSRGASVLSDKSRIGLNLYLGEDAGYKKRMRENIKEVREEKMRKKWGLCKISEEEGREKVENSYEMIHRYSVPRGLNSGVRPQYVKNGEEQKEMVVIDLEEDGINEEQNLEEYLREGEEEREEKISESKLHVLPQKRRALIANHSGLFLRGIPRPPPSHHGPIYTTHKLWGNLQRKREQKEGRVKNKIFKGEEGANIWGDFI